ATQEMSFNNKVKLRIGYFSNSDAKNSSVNQVLDAQQKQFLFNIGDSVQNALYPSAARDTLTQGKILYERVYDTLNNVVDSFYRYSIDPGKILYNLAFTEVGSGRGNYIPDNSNANGKVFVYMAPVDGVKQGNYEPVVLLVAPRKQQVLTLGMDYNITANTALKTELATSQYDVNTLSSRDDKDNKGYAAKINLSNSKQLREKNGLRLVSFLDYEYVQQRFQPLERLRDVEFTRDWGLPLASGRANENIIKASAGLQGENGNSLQYAFTNYNRSDNYNGFQNALTQLTNWKGWGFNNQLVHTQYRTDAYKGHFFRPVLDISKKISWLDDWMIGGRYTLEENINRDISNDSLQAVSFSFDTYTAYLKSNAEKRNRYAINFYTRSDKYPVGKQLVRGDRSYNLNLQAELLANAKRQFYFNT